MKREMERMEQKYEELKARKGSIANEMERAKTGSATAEGLGSKGSGGGAFAEFRRGVDLLLERQIGFMVKSVLLPPNRAEIDEFEAWASTIPGMDRLPAYAVFLDLRARRDSPAKNRLISGLRISPEEAVRLAGRRGDAYLSGMAQFSARFMRPPGDRLFTCGAGRTTFHTFCIPLRSCMMVEWRRAVPISQGIKEAFSTGSQAQ